MAPRGRNLRPLVKFNELQLGLKTSTTVPTILYRTKRPELLGERGLKPSVTISQQSRAKCSGSGRTEREGPLAENARATAGKMADVEGQRRVGGVAFEACWL
jgi:hypothetical protein